MAESIKVHEIGKEEDMVSGEIGFIFARKDIENHTVGQIRDLVMKQVINAGQIIFNITIQKKKEWEAATEKRNKFLGKDN